MIQDGILRRVEGTVLHGDNVKCLERLEPASCTAMVTDPPAGIPSLNLDFEQSFGPAYCRSLSRTFKAARRVLVPGAACVIWSYPNTFGWLQLALHSAGFEVRLVIPWMNAEGRRASKTSLAPGCEFWIVARAPGPPRPLFLSRWKEAMLEGREPRALVLGSGVGKAVDQLVGRRKSGALTGRRSSDKHRHIYGRMKGHAVEAPRAATDGGPSRFFLDEHRLLAVYGPRCRHVHRVLYPGGPRTDFPTPKAPALMVPLVDLTSGVVGVDAEPGRVLDPWCGSGGTATAAMVLGHDFVGIDRAEKAVADTRARLEWLQASGRPDVHVDDAGPRLS